MDEKRHHPMEYPTPYSELNAVLSELVQGIQAVLGRGLVAACLQGSFAVGDFDEHSDVDYLMVVEGELTAEQVAGLQALHGRIYALESYWAQHLEGSYFPKEVLRQHADCSQKLWYLDNGARALIRDTHCNTVVVRWTCPAPRCGAGGAAPGGADRPDTCGYAAAGYPGDDPQLGAGDPGPSGEVQQPLLPVIHRLELLPHAIRPAAGGYRLEARRGGVGQGEPGPRLGRADRPHLGCQAEAGNHRTPAGRSR